MRKRHLLGSLLLLILVMPGCRKGGQGITPGYMRHEEGHWQKTDTLRDGVGVHISSDDTLETITYSFSNGEEFTVESFWFEDRYFPSDPVSPGINVIRKGKDTYAMNVSCKLFFMDKPDDDGVILATFRDDMTGTASIERFAIGEVMSESTGYQDGEKYFLTPTGHFEDAGYENLKDGDKMYIVLTAEGGDMRARIAYEYSWVAEPEDIEVPEQLGPIEYHW